MRPAVLIENSWEGSRSSFEATALPCQPCWPAPAPPHTSTADRPDMHGIMAKPVNGTPAAFSFPNHSYQSLSNTANSSQPPQPLHEELRETAGLLSSCIHRRHAGRLRSRSAAGSSCRSRRPCGGPHSGAISLPGSPGSFGAPHQRLHLCGLPTRQVWGPAGAASLPCWSVQVQPPSTCSCCHLTNDLMVASFSLH